MAIIMPMNTQKSITSKSGMVRGTVRAMGRVVKAKRFVLASIASGNALELFVLGFLVFNLTLAPNGFTRAATTLAVA